MNNLDTLKIKAQRLVNHFNSGNYTLVIRETTTLLKKIPNNAFLLNLLGSCYQKIGFFEVAEKNFLQVMQSYPNNLAAMNNLANTYKDMLRFSEAENYYKNILKIDPNYINGIVNYANLKFQLDDYEGAINLYNKALNTNNDLENITVNASQTIFDNKVTIAVNAGLQRDDLDNIKSSQLKRIVSAVNLGYNASDKLNFTGGYSNFQSYTNIKLITLISINNNANDNNANDNNNDNNNHDTNNDTINRRPRRWCGCPASRR